MGQIMPSNGAKYEAHNYKRFKPSEVPPNNGSVIFNLYIPNEILAHILSFVDKKTLSQSCRFVCLMWCDIIKQDVWKIKAEREHARRFSKITHGRRFPSEVYQSICCMNPYNRNLIKNSSGEEMLSHWFIYVDGGDHWKVESPPIGVLLPVTQRIEDHPKCFVTSYHNCGKRQIIDIWKEGIRSNILDNYQPNIIVSDWYAARWDCGSQYHLNVTLRSNDDKEIVSFEKHIDMTNWVVGWKQISHTFVDYGPGVRYIVFNHGGNDSQFWAGHYGSKMADASVKLDLSSMYCRAFTDEMATGDI